MIAASMFDNSSQDCLDVTGYNNTQMMVTVTGGSFQGCTRYSILFSNGAQPAPLATSSSIEASTFSAGASTANIYLLNVTNVAAIGNTFANTATKDFDGAGSDYLTIADNNSVRPNVSASVPGTHNDIHGNGDGRIVTPTSASFETGLGPYLRTDGLTISTLLPMTSQTDHGCALATCTYTATQEWMDITLSGNPSTVTLVLPSAPASGRNAYLACTVATALVVTADQPIVGTVTGCSGTQGHWWHFSLGSWRVLARLRTPRRGADERTRRRRSLPPQKRRAA